MEDNHNKKNAATKIIVVISLFSISYAILRYHILGPVPWKDLPFYTLNKGISLCAFILLILNFSLGPLNNMGIKISTSYLSARKALGMTGFLMVLIHVFISFLLFNKKTYPQFFDSSSTLSLIGGLSMLGGILAFVVLWGYNLSFQTHLREDKHFIKIITSKKFLLISMLFTLLHLFFMGYKGWLTPSHWHGGLPPISLVCFILFVIGYVINLIGRK